MHMDEGDAMDEDGAVTVSQHPKNGQANTANANELPETNEERDKHGINKVGW